MTALLLALASSFSYGASDFLASRVAKRLAPVLLVLYSQAAQGLVLLAVVLAVRQPLAELGLAWGRPLARSSPSAWSPTTKPWPPAPPRSWPHWQPAAPWSRCWSTWQGASCRAR